MHNPFTRVVILTLLFGADLPRRWTTSRSSSWFSDTLIVQRTRNPEAFTAERDTASSGQLAGSLSSALLTPEEAGAMKRPGRNRRGGAGGAVRPSGEPRAWCSPSGARTCAATPARSRFPGGRQDAPDEDLVDDRPSRGPRGDRPRPGRRRGGRRAAPGRDLRHRLQGPSVRRPDPGGPPLRAQPGRGRRRAPLPARASCAPASRCGAWCAAASRSAPRPTWSAST